MANTVEKQVDLSTLTATFKVYKPGDSSNVATYTVKDINLLNKSEPLSGTILERAITKYLTSSPLVFTNHTAVQGHIDIMAQRTKNFSNSKKNNYPIGVNNSEANDYDVEVKRSKENTYGDLLTIAPDNTDGNGSFQFGFGENDVGKVVDVTKNFFTYGDENKANGGTRINAGSGGVYQDTIGGSDLSVFYLAEVPDMNDVLSGMDPSDWKKEVIVTEMDSVLSISYSTIREKFPIRRLGSSNPIAYTNGPRTIGGHIGFAVFVEDVLTRIRSQVRNSFKKAYDSMYNALRGNSHIGVVEKGSTDEYITKKFQALEAYYQAALALDGTQLLDSIPPFHLLIMGVNERGQFSKFIIRNVQVVDENQYQGTTDPHIINKVTYVASDIIPMSTFDSDPSSVTGSIGSLGERLESTANGLISGLPNLDGSSLLNTAKKELNKTSS